jgi:hypothetical protein
MLMDADGGTPRSLTADFDSSVESITWAPDGRSIYFTAEEKGTTPIFGRRRWCLRLRVDFERRQDPRLYTLDTATAR